MLQVVASAGGSDNMEAAAAAVGAVELSKFKAISWRQVAFDVDRYADDIDTGPLKDVLKLVLTPAVTVVQLEETPTPTRRTLPKVLAVPGK